jgi:hypothetical protein
MKKKRSEFKIRFLKILVAVFNILFIFLVLSPIFISIALDNFWYLFLFLISPLYTWLIAEGIFYFIKDQ